MRTPPRGAHLRGSDCPPQHPRTQAQRADWIPNPLGSYAPAVPTQLFLIGVPTSIPHRKPLLLSPAPSAPFQAPAPLDPQARYVKAAAARGQNACDSCRSWLPDLKLMRILMQLVTKIDSLRSAPVCVQRVARCCVCCRVRLAASSSLFFAKRKAATVW